MDRHDAHSDSLAIGEMATALDEHHPGWWTEIDLSRLNMSDADNCIGGQLIQANPHLLEEWRESGVHNWLWMWPLKEAVIQCQEARGWMVTAIYEQYEPYLVTLLSARTSMWASEVASRILDASKASS